MSKAYILVEVVALVLVASRAYTAESADCTSPQTQDALAACLTRELSEADARLNEVYTKIVSRRTGAEREGLRTAQREWMRDRDKLGRDYRAQVGTNERINALLESGAVRPNYGDTPFAYPPPAGYRSWR